MLIPCKSFIGHDWRCLNNINVLLIKLAIQMALADHQRKLQCNGETVYIFFSNFNLMWKLKRIGHLLFNLKCQNVRNYFKSRTVSPSCKARIPCLCFWFSNTSSLASIINKETLITEQLVPSMLKERVYRLRNNEGTNL